MDIESTLQKLQDMGMLRLGKPSGNYYQIYCPIHKDGQERRPSCGVLLHDQYKNGGHIPAGFVHCFTCGWAKPLPDTITEILKRKGITSTGLQWLKENIPDFDPQEDLEKLLPDDLVNDISHKLALDNVKMMQAKKEQIFVSEEELASYRYTVDYMYQRKMTDEAIQVYDVGFDPNYIPPGLKRPQACITFPVRDLQHRTLFFVRRSIEGKHYYLPKDITKPVYGLDVIPKDCNSLIICESCINAITAYTWGYPAVALLGTGNTYQVQQLKALGVHEFVLCLDPDDAGRRGMDKLTKNLSSNAIIWRMDLPEGKDVNDCTKEEFEKAYADRY